MFGWLKKLLGSGTPKPLVDTADSAPKSGWPPSAPANGWTRSSVQSTKSGNTVKMEVDGKVIYDGPSEQVPPDLKVAIDSKLAELRKTMRSTFDSFDNDDFFKV